MSPTDLAVHLDPDELVAQMSVDVRAGLSARPKTLPPKYFYDERGSLLFDEITRLPEYYPTRTERSILTARVAEIAEASEAQTLIELGSGTSEKTRLLLESLHGAGTLRRFVPFDVDPTILESASTAVSAEFPGIEVAPVVGDFERHLGLLPTGDRRMIAFLGSTIGNLDPDQRAGFFADLRSTMIAGDTFLLGLDLVKDTGRLVRAYDDAAGVTARFNLNVLRVINRELGGDFDLDAFEHRAVWNTEQEWIEMRLRSLRAQRVRIGDLGLEVDFAEGEEMRTEISSKFRRETIGCELAAAGLDIAHWWTDPDHDFALLLARPTAG